LHSLTKLETSDYNDSQDNINRNINNASNQIPNQNNRGNHGQKKKSEKKNRVLVIPKFLVKIFKNEKKIILKSINYLRHTFKEHLMNQ